MPKIIDGFKICPQCDQNKSVLDYHKNKCNPSGLSSWCKSCCRLIDNARAKLPKRKERNRHYQRKMKYGITKEEFYLILAMQKGKCKICGADKPGGMGDWHVDHSHGTNQVRGILCTRCNTLLGYAKDNPKILSNAANYVATTYAWNVC